MKKKQQKMESEEGNRNSSRLDISHALKEASSQSARKQRQQATVLASRQTLLESSANDNKMI